MGSSIQFNGTIPHFPHDFSTNPLAAAELMGSCGQDCLSARLRLAGPAQIRHDHIPQSLYARRWLLEDTAVGNIPLT